MSLILNDNIKILCSAWHRNTSCHHVETQKNNSAMLNAEKKNAENSSDISEILFVMKGSTFWCKYVKWI